MHFLTILRHKIQDANHCIIWYDEVLYITPATSHCRVWIMHWPIAQYLHSPTSTQLQVSEVICINMQYRRRILISLYSTSHITPWNFIVVLPQSHFIVMDPTLHTLISHNTYKHHISRIIVSRYPNTFHIRMSHQTLYCWDIPHYFHAQQQFDIKYMWFQNLMKILGFVAP